MMFMFSLSMCFFLFVLADFFFFFQAEDGIRDGHVTGVQTCALPISGYGYSVRIRGLIDLPWGGLRIIEAHIISVLYPEIRRAPAIIEVKIYVYKLTARGGLYIRYFRLSEAMEAAQSAHAWYHRAEYPCVHCPQIVRPVGWPKFLPASFQSWIT